MKFIKLNISRICFAGALLAFTGSMVLFLMQRISLAELLAVITYCFVFMGIMNEIYIFFKELHKTK